MKESGPARTYRGIELDERFIPNVLEHLDDWTARLSRTAAEWVERTARQLGLGDDDVRVLRLGALLHALGQVGLPPTEADTGHLTAAEEALLRRSPALLGRLLPDGELDRVIDAVVSSSERYDGSGKRGLSQPASTEVPSPAGGVPPSESPGGLAGAGQPDAGSCRKAGAAIPLFARILAVTTSFLALTMARPGATALGREEAYDRLRPEAGRTFDPKVLEALGRVLGR